MINDEKVAKNAIRTVNFYGFKIFTIVFFFFQDNEIFYVIKINKEII